MIYRKFGNMGWKVSAIGQGCWNIGNQWGKLSDLEAEKIIRTAYENGINIYDVAESYGFPNGLSEIRLGNSLKTIRDNVFVVSKIGNWGNSIGQSIPKNTPDNIRLCGHACVGRLKTEYIDVILCHEGNVQNPETYIEGFEILRKEGFIREYGISTDNINILKKFYELSGGNCKVVELGYSLLNRSAEETFFPYCEEKGIAVLVKRPLEMGLLTGKYDLNTYFGDMARKKWNRGESKRLDFEEKVKVVENIKNSLTDHRDLAAEALRFVISKSIAPIAIPGATTPEQVLNNLKVIELLS